MATAPDEAPPNDERPATTDAANPFAYLEPRIHGALGNVIDPELHRPLTQLGMVAGIRVDAAGAATVTIRLTTAGCPASRRIADDAESAVRKVRGLTDVHIVVEVMSPSERAALVTRLRGEAGTRGVPFGPESGTRVFAIASGKGGVGKSTLTANLAVALSRRGFAVGVIDADVFGFSIPGLLGLLGTAADGTRHAVRPTRVDGMILPPVAHDVRVISIGMFLDDNASAVAWRGPMLHRTIKQFLTDVHFGDIDVLLVDLPPGTGDIALSLGQLLPTADVIVVTTPQPAAAEVAERSGALARQAGQRVFGVIENMSSATRSDGSVDDLFGSGGGAVLSARLSRASAAMVPLLGSIPLSRALREGGDAGVPVVLTHPDDPAGKAIERIAGRIMDDVASRRRAS
jgi:ATP-binding protein involved in chromosome partitioning